MRAYFSCGAGDFIAIESFMSDIEKKCIKSFLLFTRAAETIEQLIRLHPVWKDCEVEIPLSEKEIFGFGVYSFYDVKNLVKKTKIEWPGARAAIDYSGEKFYPDILKGKRKFTESLFEVEALTCGATIDPESHADDRLTEKGRNFTKKELKVLEYRFRNRYSLVLNKCEKSLEESLGYVKGCQKFYGVDSMLACWAARQDLEEIVVKTVNPIYRKWLPVYDPMGKIKVVSEIR